MKTSYKIGAAAGAAGLVAAAALTATAIAGSPKTPFVPPVPPQYAGAITTTCDLQTDVQGNNNKKIVTYATVTAGNATVDGKLKVKLDSTTKSNNNYVGGTSVANFAQTPYGTHSVTLTYTPTSFSSVYKPCSVTVSVTNAP